MKRMLVVVDGSVQAAVTLGQVLEIAHAQPDSEIVLLNIPALPSPWQRHRPDRIHKAVISERVTSLALARARSAGVPAQARIEAGDLAEVAAKVAREERCDHVFISEPSVTRVVRTLMALTGLGISAMANRIRSLSNVPVTVVS